jgi:hypothetical protein
MLTVYLDQKDWIALSKACFRDDASKAERELAARFGHLADTAAVRFPVSETHLIEAARIGNPRQRKQLASVFARFGHGWFFAARHALIANEIRSALVNIFGNSPSTAPVFDSFATDFFVAFGGRSFLARLLSKPIEKLDLIAAASEPTVLMETYLAFPDDDRRREALERFTASVEQLVSRIEIRRQRAFRESADMRSRIYSVLLFQDIEPKIHAALQALAKTTDELIAVLTERGIDIIDYLPCLDVERSLALYAERDKPAEHNDVFDII